jgi:RNA polymerase sigma factor (sigma-70 family)
MEKKEDFPLIQNARSGDPHAQGLLVKRWYRRVYNFALMFLGDDDLALEVSQRTFITMYQKMDRLRDNSKFKSWLYTILVNKCREEIRNGQSKRLLYLSGEENTLDRDFPDKMVYGTPNPEEKLINGELQKSLSNALLLLSEEQREVLILKEYEGLKFREIAETLKISENTAKSRLYYALHHMRKILEKQSVAHIKHGKS